MNNLFPLQNSWLLVLAFLLAVVSIVLSNRDKDAWAITGLFFAAFTLRLFMAHLDPFLHAWDERYHVLVARNIMDYPFKPMLRVNPITAYTIDNWCDNHIWLHKQPLFLWQMALSMKVFGVSPFAIRYPAVLMGSLMVVLLYRIVLLATTNKKVAFIAAILMCFSYYHLELLSGYYGMDQNDIAFDFYVLASIGAYMEYRHRPKVAWAILIGILAGCAVLNKWLTGLLVFGAWGINILFAWKQKDTKKEIIHLLLGLLVCVIVFLPWQLYIFHTFPREAKYEFAFNSKHIWEVVESHGGTIWFYYDFFSTYFGKYIWCLLPIGILLALLLKQYRNKNVLALTACFLVVYVFFSFIAKTKVYAYFMVAVPLGYMFMAIVIYHAVNIGKLRKYVYMPAALIVMLTIFDLPDITAEHDPKNTTLNHVAAQTYNTQVYKNIKKYIPTDVKVVMNLPWMGDDKDLMFFNTDIVAYDHVLPQYQIDAIKQQGLRIATFLPKDGSALPTYILQYPDIFIINEKLK